MMAQFLTIKEDYPDAILFYRMGDFYEMFFDDAVLAAKALNIALTKRGKHAGQDIPMCGVPAHSSESYLLSLIKQGFRVAVCEQMENPAEAKKRGAKSVVKREVIRLVTPGTLTEESLLDTRKNNYLAAFADVRGEAALAWADISTGELSVGLCPRPYLSPQLARLAPRELLVPASLEADLRNLADEASAAITPLAASSFDSDGAHKRLCDLFEVESLDAYGQFGRAELAALGGILEFLELTQKGKLPLLRPPVKESRDQVMQIDAATRRNLEIASSLDGGRAGSLLGVIDRTVTGAGARLLANRLNSPLIDKPAIDARLDAISFFIDHQTLASDIRALLKQTPDIDRALTRLSLSRGGPRDVGAVKTGLSQASQIFVALSKSELPSTVNLAAQSLIGFDVLADTLKQALAEDLPMFARDGGFTRSGYNSELDEVRELRDAGRKVIANLQAEYINLSGVSSLKVKHNNVLGYFVETPSSHASLMLGPEMAEVFIHRQTTANAVRFTSVALSELETKILNAGGRALQIEAQIFEDLRMRVIEDGGAISQAAQSLAELDIVTALADLALAENWCRPVLTNERAFDIDLGRHPVVEAALRKTCQSQFVANDCDLSPKGPSSARAWLLTGPNMAGKSTFLRQNALIALLAQMGSYVPARAATIGMVTQLFSRVGASDDLARGRSTFMVEMVETAAILNQAGPGALVILDEIGRGTSTYDGLSIAWATLEHLHDVNACRILFATHYHELTALTSKLDGASNATVSVREWEGEVVFLHEVKMGAADRSYGVQVARLAGLPDAVIERAKTVLGLLEKGEQQGSAKAFIDDLPLFAVPQHQAAPKATASKVEEYLQDVLPDELSPMDALKLIYELRSIMERTK